MRLSHFEILAPICPRCKHEHSLSVPLQLAVIEKQTDEIVVEGSLLCSNVHCQAEYPIIDAIPIIIHPIQDYLNRNFLHILARDDLSITIESMLGDVNGADSDYNHMRFQLSIYAWDHFADKAPDSMPLPETLHATSGNVKACLEAGLERLPRPIIAPILDIGCATGRSSFELAENTELLTLGIDNNFSALRVAQNILRHGKASFPVRHLGVIFDRFELDIRFKNHDLLDFWACDATNLPFSDNTFNFASALNVFDIVPAPRQFLQQLKHCLNRHGQTILSTPYDWTSNIAMQQWVGGCRQRGFYAGESEVLTKQLLQHSTEEHPEILNLMEEIEHFPWHIRLHSRNVSSFDVHIMVCEKV